MFVQQVTCHPSHVIGALVGSDWVLINSFTVVILKSFDCGISSMNAVVEGLSTTRVLLTSFRRTLYCYSAVKLNKNGPYRLLVLKNTKKSVSLRIYLPICYILPYRMLQ